MGIGASVFLIAAGAILAFAVHANVNGVDIHTVGWILMAVGAIGLVTFLAVFGRRRATYVERRDVRPVGPPTETVYSRDAY